MMVNVDRNCLYKFVTLVPELYGSEHVSYNVHILIHLPDAVLNWGPLWLHSAFAYEDIIGLLKGMYHGTQLIPKQVFKYFSGWNKLHNYSALMVNSHESVVDLYKKFCNSTRLAVRPGFQIGQFVGLRKSCTDLTEFQLTAVRECLQLEPTLHFTCQSYDRFLIKGQIFSTEAYASNFRRNNSFVLLSNGCFAHIKACIVVNCDCSNVQCVCLKDIVLFVSCCTSTRAKSFVDTYVGIDLKQFVRQMSEADDSVIAVRLGDVISKCVIVNDVCKRSYALRLPQIL